MWLSELSVGESATVNNIYLKGGMRRRVFDIGLTNGTKVKCVMKSPLGDPTAYEIRGAIIALRNNDGKNIEVLRQGVGK